MAKSKKSEPARKQRKSAKAKESSSSSPRSSTSGVSACSSCSSGSGTTPKRKTSGKKNPRPNCESSTCSTGPTQSKAVEVGEPVVKSPLDTHGYKMARLVQNGLQGFLMSTCIHPLDPSFTSNKKSESLSKETCIFNKIVEFNQTYANFDTKTGSQDDCQSKSSESNANLKFCTPNPAQRKKLKKKELQEKKRKEQKMKCTQGVHEQDDAMQDFCNTKCIAALYIKAGFFQDPPEVQGMAHFVEHAISLGSKNFPEVEAFSKFVEGEGGLYNARTEQDSTIYYFYLNYEKIETALEMFVDMFAHPVFTSGDKISKEIDNVNSEFEEKKLMDELRYFALMQTCAPEGHPAGNFGMGSRESLQSEHLLVYLREWIAQYYCSENMLFMIQGPLPIPELENLFGLFCCQFPGRCSPVYKCIPSPQKSKSRSRTSKKCQGMNRLSKPVENGCGPFIMEKWNQLYHMDIAGNTTFMTISWNLDAKYGKNFKTKPIYYLSYIINWKATGSLNWYLKSKGWITSLAVNYPESAFYCNELYSMVSINIELTALGLKERMEVLKTVLQYIKLIQENGPSDIIFDEIRQLLADVFHYRSDKNLSDPTIGRWFEETGASETMCHLLHTWSKTKKSSDLLLNAFLVTEYDPELLKEYMSQLTPQKAMIVFASKEFAKDATQKEKWYKTAYFTRPICSQFLSLVEKDPRPKELCFPKKNHFLEVSFCCPDSPPEKIEKKSDIMIYQSAKGEVFYGNEKCRQGVLPSSQYILDVSSPALEDDASMYNGPSTDMLVLTMKSILDIELSLALSSLISCDVEGYSGTLRIILSGPSPKLPMLARAILIVVQNFDQLVAKNLKMVEDLKQLQIVQYLTIMDYSEDCANNLLNYVLSRRACFVSDCLNVLETSYNAEDFMFFVEDFKMRQFISGSLKGCVTRKQASTVAQVLEEMEFIPYKENVNNRPRDNATKLPRGERCLLLYPKSKENRVVVVLNYYQVGNITNLTDLQMFNAICGYLSETAFEELRTIHSLGYVADARPKEVAGVLGLVIFVQGAADKHTSGYINEQIDQFIEDSYEKCLSSTARFRDKLLPLIEVGVPLKLKDVQEFYNSHFKSNGCNLRKISIQFQGHKKMAKSQPAPACLVEEKVKRFSSGVKREPCCGNSTDDDGGSCGISRYSFYLRLCLKDVVEENGYFITDVQKFKDSQECYANLEHLQTDLDDDDDE